MSADAAALVVEEPRAPRAAPSDDSRRAGRLPAVVGIVAVGTGLTLVVGTVGTPIWCVVRALAVVILTWMAATSIRQSSARRAALTSFAVGLVGAAVGGSLATRFAAAGDWSPRVVGAVLAGVAGAVLLVGSTVALVATARRWWSRIMWVIGVIAAVFVVGEPMVIAVAATNVPRSGLGPGTPADHGLTYVDARLHTSDGVRLSGWYIPSRNGAAVVVLHGASSNRSSVLRQATVLADLGYGVLLYDARGLGQSGGRAMNLGWHGDLDLVAAIDYLEGRPDVDADRIGALGESMGGEQALGALAVEPRLRAVVAEGATSRVAGDLDWLSDVYGLRGVIQQEVDQLTTGITDLLTDASVPVTLREAVAGSSRPVLLIAAGTREDEQHAADDMRHTGGADVAVWVVPGAAHTGGLRTRPIEWHRRVG